MCGIAGSWTGNGGVASRDEVARMVAVLRHRGPDDQGIHISGGAAIGMTRLSIIDPAGGHQPISSEDGQVTVVCNGEIYNHLELRRELEARGHRFSTRSDVEVIVHLYEECGVECLQRLRGMFALAVWDERQQTLLVARDRLGIKPLFYARDGARLLFASEIKAIARGVGLSLHMDPDAFDQYLTLGYIPSPLTIYKEIRKLDPGHALIASERGIDITRYWALRAAPEHEASEAEIGRRFLELFSASVQSHLMSDVSLGAFLSGGVDSSLVVALMSEFTPTPVKTFTVGFGGTIGGHLDERPYARLMSTRYGTTHTEFEVRPNAEEVLDEIVESFDEPFADDSVIPTFYLCKLARQHVTVALTGLGGDELFAGYERHLGLKLSTQYARTPAWMRRRLTAMVNRLPERRDGTYVVNHMKRFVRSAELDAPLRYRNYLAVFDEPMKRRICADHVRCVPRTDAMSFFEARGDGDVVAGALNHDIHTYLPEDILALTDRLSMRHGLELRVPFLDHPLVEFCASIPSSLKIRRATKKYLLKKVARPFLPSEVIDHRKQGFASPMTMWLRGDLKQYVRHALAPRRLARHGLFNPDAVGALLDAHEQRVETHDRQLFALLMFQKWHERFL